jgi:hypothetical protein
MSVLFLILGITTAHGEEKATVPPQEKVAPQKEVAPQYKALPPLPGYSSGVHFRAIKIMCGPQSGLLKILKSKNMSPVLRGEANQDYMFNGGKTQIKLLIFINKNGEFIVTEWLGRGVACINLLGGNGEVIQPSFSQI